MAPRLAGLQHEFHLVSGKTGVQNSPKRYLSLKLTWGSFSVKHLLFFFFSIASRFAPLATRTHPRSLFPTSYFAAARLCEHIWTSDIREHKNNDEVHDDDVCWPGKNKVFSQRRLLKRCKIFFYKPYVYFHWRWRILSNVWPFRMEKSLLSVRRLFNFQPEWDDRVRVSVRG